ncbi:sporulation integral membrane protein YtvI [Paenibacillus sp. P96]|uniref:Sporulation integral membrane protein YtvI n=1 Tax=Paenibacillus zeirhizosphaerae TaxID=2987519 RepID=A0ABT9FT97_9BACL|nr:sporulation integral membrane protein YtvI [Paenibacillus sp. P96]MDP4097921.1 sporulation integral membrane protein YtvI [Paenibacillus sp. P96]
MSGKQLIFILLGLILLYGIFTVGAPFLLAFIVAIFLEPLVGFLMGRLKMSRVAACTVSGTVFLLVLFVLAYIMGARLFAQLIEYWRNAPFYFQSANEFIQHTFVQAEGLFRQLPPETTNGIGTFMENVSSYALSLVNTLSAGVLSFAKEIPNMFIFFIVFCVAVFLFSFSLDTMRASVLSFFEEKSRDQVSDVLVSLKKSIFGFLRAQIILCLLTYVETLIGLLILGVDYPLAIALLVMVVDLLPILGVGSVLVPWAVYLFITGDIFTGIGLLILFIVITVLRRVIEPKVIGDAVGIGALPALVSLYVGFKLVGVIGFFIGPLVIIIYSAIRKAGLFQIKIKF